MIIAHPWILQLNVTEPPLTPNQVGWMEVGLDSMSGTPLTEQEKLSSMLLVDVYVRGQLRLSMAINPGGGDLPEAALRYGRRLASLIDPVAFPRIAAAIFSGALDDETDMSTDEFEFGLSTVLDGVATLVARHDQRSSLFSQMRNPLRRPDLSGYPRLAAADARSRPAAQFGRYSWAPAAFCCATARPRCWSTASSRRPGLPRMLLRRIGPDHRLIADCLARVGLGTLSAVLCAHSHYDHALDSPVIAERYGAVLVGSESTATIGRGYGLPDDRIRVVSDGETLRFGAFDVTMVHSVHSPGDAFPGEVTAAFSPPARASAWRTGTAYSIFFDHPAGSVLVHASANYLPGKLADRRADVVYLGIGGLGKQTPQFRIDYWNEVVLATGARRVIPVHWDDFWRPLRSPLRPQRYLFDRIDVAMQFLMAQGSRDGVEIVHAGVVDRGRTRPAGARDAGPERSRPTVTTPLHQRPLRPRHRRSSSRE